MLELPATSCRASSLVVVQRWTSGWMDKFGRWGADNRASWLFRFAAFFALLLILRHPRGLLDANLWAEDGWVWFPDAYNFGLSSLIRPHSGYLQTFSRVIAAIAQPFPLAWAPTVFAVAAFAVRLLPPLLLLSRRFDAIWPSLAGRLLLSTIYICLPNSFEGFANVTNSQWHLAIAGFLLVTAAPAGTVAGRARDLAALAFCGLSGPFCIMLLPIAAWVWFRPGLPESRDRFLCLVGCSLVQGYLLVLTAVQTRSSVSLGADGVALARILAVQVELGLVLGSHVVSRLARSGTFDSTALVLVVAALGVAACSITVWKGPDLFRKFAVFGGLVFAASLVSPVVSLDAPAWVVLARPGAGQRYFLIPMLVLVSAGIALASYRVRGQRIAGLFLCFGMMVGVAGDWPYPRMRPTDFVSRAKSFELAPRGTEMSFPIHPTGVASMVLIKK